MSESIQAPLFRLGSVPAGGEEFRAFYQRRVSIFLCFAFSFWAVAWALSTGLALLTRPEDVLQAPNSFRVALHFLVSIVCGVMWLRVRRGTRSEQALSLIDGTATILQASVLGVMIAAALPIVRYRPDILFVLGLTYVLVARAAVVPSTPLRTGIIGVIACVPVAIGTLSLYRMAYASGVTLRQYFAQDSSTPELYLAWTLVFCSLSIAVSSFVSAVIYGLQREVARARQLGQYTLEHEIGSGGMGVVYLARHALLRRPTAVKLLLPERAGTSALVRFEREVQITSLLTHPNTVAVYDYGRTVDGTFYYAMEYLDGVDLEQLVTSDGPQPAGRVLHFLRQSAGALAEAHERGLIHRDIKPSNLIVCERGLTPDFIKVLDFGLARAIDTGQNGLGSTGVTHAGQITGTPLYMSPEQIQTPELVDGRSDLYALAAVGYYLLTGQPVFVGSTVVEICAHHLCSPVVPPSQRSGLAVPKALEGALLACLEKDRSKRPSSAAAFLTLLDACDDVASWSLADAKSWWQAKGSSLRSSQRPEAQGSMTIELSERIEASLPVSARNEPNAL